MMMYNTGVHSRGKATIVFSGDVSSTRQHSISGTPLKTKKFASEQRDLNFPKWVDQPASEVLSTISEGRNQDFCIGIPPANEV